MAYDTTVHIGENSPEQVAYKLLEEIAFAEGKSLRAGMTGQKADRAYILSTYWEVLEGRPRDRNRRVGRLRRSAC